MDLMNSKNNRSDSDLLQRAIAESRESLESEADLSPAARAKILRAAYESRSEAAAYRPLLGLIPRKLLAGAFPVLAAAVVVLFLADRGGDPANARHLTVRAAKTGDEVVFTIANGHSSHVVYKSSQPNRFDPATGVSVRDGAFRDTTDDGSGLVFYRID